VAIFHQVPRVPLGRTQVGAGLPAMFAPRGQEPPGAGRQGMSIPSLPSPGTSNPASPLGARGISGFLGANPTSWNPGQGFQDLLQATLQAQYLRQLGGGGGGVSGATPGVASQAGAAASVTQPQSFGASRFLGGVAPAFGSPGDMSWANLPSIPQVQALAPTPTPPAQAPTVPSPAATSASQGMTYVPGAGLVSVADIQAAQRGAGSARMRNLLGLGY
jgi:hypothetical protein